MTALDLFPDLPEQKSPYLEFRDRHGIRTKYRKDIPAECGRWEAWMGDYEEAVKKMDNENCYPCESPSLAYDNREIDAVRELAERNQLEGRELVNWQ